MPSYYVSCDHGLIDRDSYKRLIYGFVRSLLISALIFTKDLPLDGTEYNKIQGVSFEAKQDL